MIVELVKPEGISDSLWDGLNDCGKRNLLEAIKQVEKDAEAPRRLS